VEDDAPHASTKKNREAMYAFFQKHLNNPGSSADLEITQLTADEMRVTGTGVVSTSLGGETVHSLNLKEVQLLQNKLQAARSAFPGYLTEIINSAKKLSGYRTPVTDAEPIFTGRFQKEGYITEKYFIKGEGDYMIPYLLMIPEKTTGKSLIYLNPSGKSAEAGPDGEMEWFVKNGFILLAPDLVGIGEMGPGSFRGDAYISGSSHNIWYASIQIGRSIAGVRTADVIRLAQILKNRNDIREIYGLAGKNLAPVMLHAAAFDKDIKRIALVEPYSSYLSIVMNRFYNPTFIHDAVPGSLKAYDLPDLSASLAPRRLLISGATDGNGQKTDTQSIEKDFTIIRTAYTYFNAGAELTIAPWDSDKKPFGLYREWIR